MSAFNPNEPCFSAWLTTKLCRNWDEAMVVVNNDWSEANYAILKREEAILRRKREANRQPDVNSNCEEEDLFVIKVIKTLMHRPKVERGESEGGMAPKEDAGHWVDRDNAFVD